MVQQIQDELLEIRPGRKLFVRHWILGNDSSSSSDTNSKTINLVCVHGTVGTQEHYVPVWKALDEIMTSDDTKSANKSICVHVWGYDAIACGKSPKLNSPNAYKDEEQVADLKSLLENHVFSSSQYETYLMGHSYGPTWIYKYLSSSSTTTKNIAGLILICSGLRCKELVVGGPKLFQYAPLWLLNCIQPMLTDAFLQIGFSPTTHKEQPKLIAQEKLVNNQNDMQTCVYYYGAHDWLAHLDPETLPKKFLVMHGVDDEVIPIHCGQDLANELKTPLISVPNASHEILLEQPKAVAENVWAFCNE